jgi:DNA-binding NarL/FixJ family response regulator
MSACIDLKGAPPTRRTVAAMLHEMKESGGVTVINAHRISPGPPELIQFTAMQRRVAAGIRKGLSNRAIAFELKISEQGVKNCCFYMYKKAGLTTRLQLLIYLAGYPEFQ